MNQEIKAKWVTALRSGEYKQGIGMLRRENGDFCCLGVLCDLHSKETGTEWETDSHDKTSYLNKSGSLPIDVGVWANMTSDYYTSLWRLISMNDTQNCNFKEISEYIEKVL